MLQMNFKSGVALLLIEVESACGGSDADVSVLNSNDVQIHEVAMHLPVARRRVPATHGQNFQALHRLQMETETKAVKNKTKTSDVTAKSFINSHLPVFVLWLKGN